MNLHLAEIATQIAPGAHAALLVDQAGWHLAGGLIVPPNITLIPLPPKCPELNPQENIWQFMRENCTRKAIARRGAQPSTSSASSAPMPKSIPPNDFAASYPRTVANDADGSGREQLPTVRANPLKLCVGTAADGEDAKLPS